MLKMLDILLGLTVVMLMVSLIVTVLTQIVANLSRLRGKHLLKGIADLLQQIDPKLKGNVADKVAEAVLRHPLIRESEKRLGSVIHREELTTLLLELAAGKGPAALQNSVKEALVEALKNNNIKDPGQALENVRSLALHLEAVNPELSNNTRHALALLQEANSQFLGKVNAWFDQTMDRVSERFTLSTRKITFVCGLVVALLLQLDTIALVNRLAADPELRKALVEQAVKMEKQGPPALAAQPAQPAPAAKPAVTPDPPPPAPDPPAANSGAQGTPPAQQAGAGKETAKPAGTAPAAVIVPKLSDTDQENLGQLMRFEIIRFPQTGEEWKKAWDPETLPAKLPGILLTALLLSLGAPFWYNTLKNLVRLRSLVASKDDDQRQERQTTQAPAAGAQTQTPAADLLVGERGNLSIAG